MVKVPFGCAVILLIVEIILAIATGIEELWYTVVLNLIFIIIAIVRSKRERW